MNKNSHSEMTTIYDYAKVDGEEWKKALEMVFEDAGYTKHYKKMIKQS